MRTLTRRGLMAGALTVLAPVAQLTTAQAEEDETPGTIRIKSDGSVELDMESTLAVEARPGLEAVEESVAEELAAEEPPSLGRAIADFGLAYVGYPYVAAGNTPAGFDCSGFTQWVMLNVLGVDIGHALEGQPAVGYWIEWGAWAPGDLVFFQNTYKPGLSHDGIYVGDGLMVHAANETTGVLVSSLYSDYYAPRYWGATRLV